MPPETPPHHIFDIREFGAKGDGKNKDTKSIQNAVNACGEAGGGTVYLPPGCYLSGTIVLKSRVKLHLESGAILKGSPDRQDYIGQNNPVPDPHLEIFQYHLIAANDSENISITGAGAIDGNGCSFFAPGDVRSHMKVRDWRPGPMICFYRCSDVAIEGISLFDSPCYSVHLIGCERVTARGLYVKNHRWGPNTDGINPDSCRDVRISDCVFDTGDDCIALKSHSALLPDPRPCENITVTNCTMTTTCCGVRIGYEGDSPIRNCSFNNLVMHNIQTGIDILVPAHEAWGIYHGPLIENINFNNIVIDGRKAVYVWAGDHEPCGPAGVRHLNISNVTATTEHAIFITGGKNIPARDVSLSNLDLTVYGESSEALVENVPQPTSCWGCPGIPHAIYLRDLVDFNMSDVRVKWGELAGPWTSVVRGLRTRGLDVVGLRADAPPASKGPTIHLTDSTGARFRMCRADRIDAAWLKIDGASEGICAAYNDIALLRSLERDKIIGFTS